MSLPHDPWFQEPDLHALIDRCLNGCADSDFAKFRSAWHPYLEAALALVDSDLILTKALYDKIYEAYLTSFRESKKALRTGRQHYLLALSYQHLLELRGEGALEQLLEHLLEPDTNPRMSKKELQILVFCAILCMPSQCISPLLTACFPSPSFQWALDQSPLMRETRALEQVPSPCSSHLKHILWMALR